LSTGIYSHIASIELLPGAHNGYFYFHMERLSGPEVANLTHFEYIYVEKAMR
jgi:hypothetical protein